MPSIRRCGIVAAVIVALARFGAAPALAATHTWIGPINGTWSNPANWSGGKPTSGESGGTIVQFGANTTSYMDISGLVVDQIHFTGANNTINGIDALTISGSALVQNIVSDAGGNTLSASLAITISGAAVEGAASAGTLTIASPISGSDGLVFTSTGGAFSLTGNNTYTGATNIMSGAVHIGTAFGDVIAGSSLTVGDGLGTSAQLILEQDNDISSTTPITVNSDGVFNFNTFLDTAHSLTVNGGTVQAAILNMGAGSLAMNGGTLTIGNGNLTAGSLSMTGGTISGSGTGVLALAGNIQATSSPSGPATLASGVRLSASPTITVTPGSAPEFLLAGAISETGGPQSVTKAGTGTMLTSAANTYTGSTTVSAGTLIENGSEAGAFSVSQPATLTGTGTVGATTVAGVLAPTAPGLKTGSLSFGPTGRLATTISSAAAGAIPSVLATGAVTIDPSAALDLVVAPGIALPHALQLVLIGNDGSDPISGQFNGVPANDVLTTPEGIPLTVRYAGGDGNDMSLTPGNITPVIGSITATPRTVATGRRVVLRVAASDANQDPLATSWSFGDGRTGTGASVSHTYAAPGRYTVVASVSDGLVHVQSHTVINVTLGSATIRSSAFGADFGFTVPNACVRKGTAFSVALTIAKRKGHHSRLVKVTNVVFALGLAGTTDRSAPFSGRLTVPPTAGSHSKLKLSTKAYLKLRGGLSATKSLAVALRVC